MNLSDLYTALHGGDRASGAVIPVSAASGPARVVARIRSISYTTERDGERGIWEHEFSAKPALLCDAPGGAFEHVRSNRNLVLIGWAIDLITTDGRRVLVPGMAACSDQRGRLRVAWLFGARYSLHCDDTAIRVTERGIIG